MKNDELADRMRRYGLPRFPPPRAALLLISSGSFPVTNLGARAFNRSACWIQCALVNLGARAASSYT